MWDSLNARNVELAQAQPFGDRTLPKETRSEANISILKQFNP
jgi:hypothetical protein